MHRYPSCSRLRQIFFKVRKFGTRAQVWMHSYTDIYTHRRPGPKEVYIRAHMRILIQAYLHPTHVHMQILILVNTYIDIYTQLHALTHVCGQQAAGTYTFTSTHVYIGTCTYTSVPHVHMDAHVDVHVRAYTHIHTQLYRQLLV